MLIPGGYILLPRRFNQNTGHVIPNGTDLSDHDIDSLVEINNNSDNSSLTYSSDHDADSLSEVAVREKPIIPERAVILAGAGEQEKQEQQMKLELEEKQEASEDRVEGGNGGGAVVLERKDTLEEKDVSEEKVTSEEKTVPAIEAASPAAVTTNPEDIAIALLQKQKETIRVVTLSVNEIVILSYEFANSTIDLRLTNLRHLNNITALAAGDEANMALLTK